MPATKQILAAPASLILVAVVSIYHPQSLIVMSSRLYDNRKQITTLSAITIIIMVGSFLFPNLQQLSFPSAKAQVTEKTDIEEEFGFQINRCNSATVKPGANLSNCNFASSDLSNANLQGADLTNANLQAADLSDALLKSANLKNANLQGADLSNSNLQRAHFEFANLQAADLTNANLKNADLTGAVTQGADFSGSNRNGCIGCPD
jgi:hypothetical protein